MKKFLNALFFFLLLTGCNKELKNENNDTGLLFDSLPVVTPVVQELDEVSGIADSQANPGFLWVEEDSGNPPELILLEHDGNVSKKIFIQGVTNRDWEDMALSGNEIYIADIGDNEQRFQNYFIYFFAEPLASEDTVTGVTTIKFQYPDGSHDAEAFLIDPVKKDIFIITKRDNPSRVYKLSFPYDTGAINSMTFEGSLPYAGVVSAALARDGTEIIIKTYTNIYYYRRKPGETIAEALQNTFTLLPYIKEPQGEAVCFANNNSGFFTLSEKGISNTVNLYFYRRQ